MRPFRDTEIKSAALAPMRFLVAFGVFGLLAVGGCDLDLENPNAPTEEEVLSAADGIIALAVGMQDQYASAVDDLILPSSLGTDEWGTDTRSLLSYRTLFNDPAGLDASYLVVENPFAATYSVVKSANNLIENAPNVGLSTGTETGIVVLARLFKAMALGMAIQIFEEIPLDVSQPGPLPESREAVMTEVLDLLETARSDLGGVTDDDLAGFRSRVLGTGFDLRNTVDAMLARFYLMVGEYTVLSTFTYASPDVNPIRNLSFGLIYVAPLASFDDGAEPGDLRPGYWVDLAADPYPGNPADTLLLPLNKYTNNSDPYPVYLPDEMKLVKAEAYTRLSQFGLAAGLVNEVHTQLSSPLDEPVAGLPEIPADQLDSEAELLAQIAYERRYELYMQGLRWEDTRRLGTSITVTPVHDWLPLPRQECISNPGAGC